MHCLLLELRGGAREEQRLVGSACALGLASALTGAPLPALAWHRACPLSKPQVVTAAAAATATAAPLLPLLPLNLSHEGRLLAVAFLPPAMGAQRCLGVDVQGCARAARALATAAATGDPAGEALLRGGSASASASALPTPRALLAATAAAAAAAAAAPPSPLLFAARWTLMEAVLKARGQGLAVAGAGAAVLASALEVEEWEEEEEEEEGQRAAAVGALAPLVLWGARAPAGGWSVEGVHRAAAAAAAAAAAGGAGGAAEGLERVPHALLARFRGCGWRAVTCSLSWPPAAPHGAEAGSAAAAAAPAPDTTVLTLALLNEEGAKGEKASELLSRSYCTGTQINTM
jgi:hypothetical protein